MKILKGVKGYQEDFLGKETVVPLPALSAQQEKEVAPVKDASDNVLRYQNYSVVQNARRGFPFFTAANIDGKLFKTLERNDRWMNDPRIDRDHQWGAELYKAPKSDFDKGHMTKREDVQWGKTAAEAKKGALLTFFYTNAVPQVAKLNQNLWRSLEDYILKNKTVNQHLKITMFTGPVLSDKDPVFVSKVDGKTVKIPTLFWKVIYFTKSDGRLYRVAFLMGQEELLETNGITIPKETRDIFMDEEDQLFLDYGKADIYQVNIQLIEKLTKLRFPPAIDPFTDERSTALVLTEVQTRGLFDEDELPFEIEGLAL